MISGRVVETRVSGYPLSMRFVLNFAISALNATGPLICISLNKNSIYVLCLVLQRTSTHVKKLDRSGPVFCNRSDRRSLSASSL